MGSTRADVLVTSWQVPTLETERLRLRPWRATDAEEYARIIGDPEVMRHVGAGLRYRARLRCLAHFPVLAEIDARRTIGHLTGHWERYGFGEWAVEEKASSALIGQIGLVHLLDWTADSSNVEVGWLLARHTWGRGLATEGGKASLAYAFEQVGLERVVSVARRANERSERVMQRLGLSLAGRTHWKGSEVVWYAIDREQWTRSRADAGAE
jgi:ribosomal-protein-alanine N-acetyltransferase